MELVNIEKELENIGCIAFLFNGVDAMLVKLSDLTDNLDQGTLPVIADKDRDHFMVYENARTTIMCVLARDYPDTFKEIMMSK